MPAYTFYLHDGAGTVPAFEIELLDNDTYAVVHGRKLLRERPRYSTVEITEGPGLIGSKSQVTITIAPRSTVTEPPKK